MENKELVGYVHSLESFGSVDGPGVRYVVFLSGCAMRCQFCHNPDTWQMSKGTPYTAEELLKKAIAYRPYWKSEGGITVSGGEPLLQIDFLIDFLIQAETRLLQKNLTTQSGKSLCNIRICCYSILSILMMNSTKFLPGILMLIFCKWQESFRIWVNPYPKALWPFAEY